MAYPEIDSFVLKFKNLLLAGIDANLTINSNAGKAVLTLTAEVDVSSHAQPHHHLRHVGAARVRRREKRAEARAAADLAGAANVVVAEEAANPETTAELVVSDEELVEEDTEEVINEARTRKVTDEASTSKKASEQEEITDIEISVEDNSCDRCDFVGKTAAGLKTHKTTKHLFGRF